MDITRDNIMNSIEEGTEEPNLSGEEQRLLINQLKAEKAKQHRLKLLLEAAERRFNAALDNSDIMVWEYDMVNSLCINSRKAGRDYDIPEVIENYPESLYTTGHVPPETIEQIKEAKRRLFAGESGFSYERRTIDKFGKSNWQKVEYTLEKDEAGRPVRAIVCGLDINAKKELEASEPFLRDPVTGLYNRPKCYLECTRIMNEHPDEPLMMIHFDIQRFRLYNSFFGEYEGDQLLKYLGNTFKSLAKEKPYGVYGRLEADVFMLCYPYDSDGFAEDVKRVHAMLQSYREDFHLAGSCGIYIIKDRSLTAEACFNRAAIAAKSNRNRQVQPISFFDESMENKLKQDQEIIREMRHALTAKQFKVYLQPKYDLASGMPYGAEALVRWQHPRKGIIMPGSFIPLFEANGFITTLDRYMWEEVCRLLRKWLDEGLNPKPVSVNVSRVSMYSPKTIPFLQQMLKKYALAPRMLNLELTESTYMDDAEEMKKRLIELRSNGFEIMMDDFGSGYSSLNTLRDIPVDYIKVDRMFLASVEQDVRSRLVMAAVVQMAARMGLPVIVEGVETKAQETFLQTLACDYVQGFLYAKPMPVEAYEATILKPLAAKDSKTGNIRRLK